MDATADPRRWVEPLARAGFAAKGIVYLILGGLATSAALGAGGRITDMRGALRALRLAAAGPDVYVADDWLTLRFADAGQTLLVSGYGARRVWFSRASADDGPAPVYIRGLR